MWTRLKLRLPPVAIEAVLAVTCYATLTAGAPEYAVKAAYLYNFAKFTEWSNMDKLGSLTVCVYGRDPFGGSLMKRFAANWRMDCRC